MGATTRRNALRAAAAVVAAGAGRSTAEARRLDGLGELQAGGRDVSPITGAPRQAVPSVCWQCVAQDPIIGYLEGGRIVKIEGHPAAPSSAGRVCAKGQAGINQVYNPDRLLYPLLRTGARGGGGWQRTQSALP